MFKMFEKILIVFFVVLLFCNAVYADFGAYMLGTDGLRASGKIVGGVFSASGGYALQGAGLVIGIQAISGNPGSHAVDGRGQKYGGAFYGTQYGLKAVGKLYGAKFSVLETSGFALHAAGNNTGGYFRSGITGAFFEADKNYDNGTGLLATGKKIGVYGEGKTGGYFGAPGDGVALKIGAGKIKIPVGYYQVPSDVLGDYTITPKAPIFGIQSFGNGSQNEGFSLHSAYPGAGWVYDTTTFDYRKDWPLDSVNIIINGPLVTSSTKVIILGSNRYSFSRVLYIEDVYSNITINGSKLLSLPVNNNGTIYIPVRKTQDVVINVMLIN